MAGSSPELTRFARRFFAEERPTRIGDGAIGGKAHGLVRAGGIVARVGAELRGGPISIGIPRMTVLATDVFDAFLTRNRLDGVVRAEGADDRIALAFQHADLPVEFLGDLRALVEETRLPLAVRSSSLLEDALERPFAGVYGTKMVPNGQLSADARFQQLVEAVKFVYASTFFRAARDYARAAGRDAAEEKMAVIVQEVVGRRFGDRYYPHVSGVAKSFHYYPPAGVRPQDGVVSLALGLGKTIVDGGVCWSYSPARPAVAPPFASALDQVRGSQSTFWAVNMGRPPAYDPTVETEYLVEEPLASADSDDTLRWLASTYDPESDRLRPGTSRPGPRAVDFAPLLRFGELPLNDVLRALLAACEREAGTAVEIEFALSLVEEPALAARLGFLQQRPMAAAEATVDLDEAELADPAALVVSRRALGNGVDESIHDVVYVKPERFDRAATPRIAEEVARLNHELVAAGRPFLLLGFGRWGSADPWLGIPVEWGQIAGARAIVESTLPELDVEPSQGSHFFHNLSAFRVSYFMVHHAAAPPIDWGWLAGLPAEAETEHVRHVRTADPLLVKVDGRQTCGVIRRPGKR